MRTAAAPQTHLYSDCADVRSVAESCGHARVGADTRVSACSVNGPHPCVSSLLRSAVSVNGPIVSILSCTHTTRVDARSVQNAEIESGSNSASILRRFGRSMTLTDGRCVSNHQSHRTTISRGTLHIHNLNVPCAAAEVNFVFLLRL